MKYSGKRIYRNLLILALVFQLNNLQGQLLVHEEPRHRLIFQNTDVRILNVLVPPGDTSAFHIHHTPSVFIFFTNTLTGSEIQGKASISGKSSAGRITFENLSPPDTRTHRVWNSDVDTFHVMDIELLYKHHTFVQPPLMQKDVKLEIDTIWIRSYRLKLSKGNEFKLTNKNQSFILVSLNTSTVQTTYHQKSQVQTVKSASFFDLSKQERFSLKNISEGIAEFILLEMPVQ